jgi:hypothetical protein
VRKPVNLTAPYRADDDDIQDYKKPWVGLTHEQVLSCVTYVKGGCDIEQTAKNIELKLKALNYD